MRTILQDVDRVIASNAYKVWANSHRIDAGKVTAERKGTRRPLPNDSYGRTLVEAIRRGHEAEHPVPIPDPPLPNPPPGYVRVAPRVAYKQGSSDARFCTINQPGVVRDNNAPAGHTVDESGATYDDNGLCKNGLRSDAPAVTGALEIDGRNYCDLPTMGDPTKNTGSWAI